MFYLASGYEERVGEGLESRVTRLCTKESAWMHLEGANSRTCWARGRTRGAQADERERAGRTAVLRYCSPESTGPESGDKGKAPVAAFSTIPEATPLPAKKVTDQEAKAFMKVIKASEYKVVEQMGKSPAHISLLTLLLSSEPHRDALLKVLTIAQVPKETTPDKMEETVNSIFSNQISFAKDELPFEGQGHLRALHIFCKCSNYVVGRVMIDNGSALNVCSVSTLKQMNFFVKGKLITVNGEEDYAVYKETTVPYISIGEDQNLPFHSFDTISMIRDYGEVGPSRADRMIGKVMLKNDYIPRTGLEPLEAFLALLVIYAVIEETYSGIHIRPAREDEELPNWTIVPLYSAMVADVVSRGLCLVLRRHARLRPFNRKAFPSTHTKRFPPKRQHLRRQQADLLLRIKKEVIKQVDAGFLEVCNYSEWVANIVPMEKKNGKVRVCIDYRDLNRANPKDNFPLPHIYVLVNNTARHTQFSFMDGFSRYNQIQMAEEDKIKTTFITMWGTFCYKRLFDRLKKYKLRLNPAKCTFGVKSGKLLGFVVSENDIKVDPDKVKVIMELPPPSTMREVTSFLGRLNYIVRFIANLTDKCQPLFRLLCKNAAVEWDDKCQKAFDTVKAYLVQPLVLVPPSPDRPLILYLTIRRQSIGCMLGQKDDSTHAERAIY
ncbi:hypothetical protein CRG98_021352 [Punica granatum]|uniref:Reverse transcriptase/retrotransposon-derived protein RNase H-like domain-containing protein n=1 Tax=Punica granatum TaxID=22663 RepID=A0A2I0JQU3_PUNGR|nr:hypothetical protein CRG98_021352 [Punica granatum]